MSLPPENANSQPLQLINVEASSHAVVGTDTIPENPNQDYQEIPIAPVVYGNPEADSQGNYDPIQNQTSPQTNRQTKEIDFKFRSDPAEVNCPYCNETAKTKVVTKYSISNICCSIWGIWVFWVVHQYYQKKDLNCKDATHQCSKCNKVLGTYHAC